MFEKMSSGLQGSEDGKGEIGNLLGALRKMGGI
jgi:hypothetical protein